MSGVHTTYINGETGHFDVEVTAVPATFADLAAARAALNTLVTELEAAGLVVVAA